MTNKDAEILIDYIRKSNYKPNDWEDGFIEDMSCAVDCGRDLTHKQGKCLEGIYAKSTGGGQYCNRKYI